MLHTSWHEPDIDQTRRSVVDRIQSFTILWLHAGTTNCLLQQTDTACLIGATDDKALVLQHTSLLQVLTRGSSSTGSFSMLSPASCENTVIHGWPYVSREPCDTAELLLHDPWPRHGLSECV